MAETVTIIGSGSWATALTKILEHNGHDVVWWFRNPETVEYIRKYRHNPKYLSIVEFDLKHEKITSDLKEAVSASEWLVLAVPSYYLAETLKALPAGIFEGKKLISAIKGIIQDGNLLISEYLNQKFKVENESIVNISGPCHAEEVAAEKLSYLTFSSPNETLAEDTAALFRNRFVYTTHTNDLIGTEYASVLKNVYALTAGISLGLNYGDNFRAVLISAAMLEMQYFLDNIMPVHRSILSPPYLGDTLVTAYSQYSRNRTFGVMIGKGYSIQAAKLELNMVAEGYYSTNSLYQISQKAGLKMPILETVYKMLYEHYDPAHGMAEIGKLIS